jgi:hypothetical protein
MAGLVPAIHVDTGLTEFTWMPGTRPGMTDRAQSLPGREGGIVLE